jgi:hypothetical protein
MKRMIDDLPMVKASTMAAAGLIEPGTRSTTVQFGDVGYGVGVKVHRFPKCRGWWALFICPRCGGGAQRLRLLDDQPAWRVRSGEWVEISFAVDAHREASFGYRSAADRPIG